MRNLPDAVHRTVCDLPGNTFGYFAWPSVARLEDGRLAMACSGFRLGHICPFGKTVLCLSADEGETWGPPQVITDTSLDDRDAGVVALGGGSLLVTHFRHPLTYLEDYDLSYPEGERRMIDGYLDLWRGRELGVRPGSFARLSRDGGVTFSDEVQVPVSAPHGPAALPDGRLLYLGKGMYHPEAGEAILAYESLDAGASWKKLGGPPLPEGAAWANLHEPHCAALPSGRLLGMIRYETRGLPGENPAYNGFSMFQTHSDDGGRTWSQPVYTGFAGSPPHLLVHPSGAVVLVYGRREAPYGQCARVSRDGGASWGEELALRLDGPSADLGYPATAALADGSLLTVYYQAPAAGRKCAILSTRWRLPDID